MVLNCSFHKRAKSQEPRTKTIELRAKTIEQRQNTKYKIQKKFINHTYSYTIEKQNTIDNSERNR